MKMRTIGALLLVVLFSASLYAQLVTVDENGNGTVGGAPMPGSSVPDPSGGLGGKVLVYPMLFPVFPGDVILHDTGGAISDVIRFFNPNQNQTFLIFYSDNLEGLNGLADTGFPALSQPQVNLAEAGPWPYEPTSGGPGYKAPDGQGMAYQFNSGEGGVPEGGSSVLLLTLGLLGLWGTKRTLTRLN